MSLKSRYGILCFMVLFSLCSCFNYYDGTKMRALKIQEYGEKLSSVEDGRYIESTSNQETTVQDKDVATTDTDAGNDVNESSTTSSTKCTTDKEIDIGNFQPVSAEEKAKGDGEVDDQTNALEKPGTDSKESTKVYTPPKKERLPDHYIDDV